MSDELSPEHERFAEALARLHLALRTLVETRMTLVAAATEATTACRDAADIAEDLFGTDKRVLDSTDGLRRLADKIERGTAGMRDQYLEAAAFLELGIEDFLAPDDDADTTAS